jgi:uncharacterized protein (UPF0332 family)
VNDEQRKYVHKAKESLRAAEALCAMQSYEIAVSRAYYTMFYCASALLVGKGLRFRKHSSLLSAFGEHFARTGEVPPEYHRYLIHAFDERSIADYTTEENLGAEDADATIQRAREFIEMTERMLGT